MRPSEEAGAPGRVMAIDYGRRYVGVAVSDPLRTIASPLLTVRVQGPREALGIVAQLVRRHEVSELVVGLPLGGEGEEGAMAQEVRRWAERLRRRCNLPVHLVDESLTSREAARTGVRRHRARREDHVAAALVLEDFLRRCGRSR